MTSTQTRLGLTVPCASNLVTPMSLQRMKIHSGLPIDYALLLRRLGPIAYWILGDAALPTAHEEINSPAQDGTHVGVTLGQPGIGDGRTCPYYDGTNDYTDIYSVTFDGVFDGSEGTLLVWARAGNAGVWTDGQFRVVCSLYVDASNSIILRKNNGGALAWIYEAGGTVEQQISVYTPTDFFQMAITWSATADEVIYYYNGAKEGATDTGLGVWAGNLSASATVIGAQNTTPTQPWDGRAAHVAVWSRALAPGEVAHAYDCSPWILAATYAAKALGYNPIAYWPAWEGAGATAVDQVNSPAQDGTYVGAPTFGQTGIGDGNTCALYDGANDNINITSAAFTAAFDMNQGTAVCWARVTNAGVWTDGAVRNVLYIRNGGYTDLVTLHKSAAAGTLTWQYRAGGVDDAVSLAGLATTDWMCLAITWDVNAGATGEVRAYYNGAQTGATQVGLGVPGAIDRGYIGSDSAAQRWDGYLTHCIVYDRALTPAEVADLYVVP